MNKNVKWVLEQMQTSFLCNYHERQYLAEQIVERIGKPFGLDNATIRLLKVLGELTPDVEINDAVTAMSVACCRIKRLEDGWHKIEERWFTRRRAVV